jgi:hypothetical protein
MSSDCRTGLTPLIKCQRNNVNDSIQRRLSYGGGWRIPPRQRIFLALLILLGCLLLQTAAQAATITVNVLTDEVEDTCPATCSIRAALASANPGDEIQFGESGIIWLTQGELVVDKDLTITGPGAELLTFDGNWRSRVLRVNREATATIKGLTIQHGSYFWDGGEPTQGGGGIYNEGALTLIDAKISENSASFGGGIYNSGTLLTLTNSAITGNFANENGGGIALYPCTDCQGSLTVTNSTISENRANTGNGGAIYNGFGELTVTNSTFSANRADYGSGGAIYNDADGTLALISATLSGNGSGVGGGIFSDGPVTLGSSIVTGSPSGGNCSGSLISLGDNISSDDTCFADDSTLNDRANTDPLLDPAGLQDYGGPTLTIALLPESPAVDSVLYNACPPPTSDQRGVPRPAGERCDIGAIEAASSAVALDVTPYSDPNTIDLGAQGEITVAILSAPSNGVSDHFNALDIDPLSIRLGPKRAEIINSPGLIEDVNHDGLPDLVLQFSSPTTGIRCGDDAVQMTGRTFVGIEIEGTDIIQTEDCRKITVNVLTDQAEDSCPETCSIRAALTSANAGDEIQFGVSGTIVLTQGELVVYNDLIIKGPGQERLAIDANSASRVLSVNPWVTASLEGLTLQNGFEAFETEGDNPEGGGINNAGNLILASSTLIGNHAEFRGGGIYNGGALTLNECTLSGNSASSGGGIYNQDRENNHGGATVSLINSTISGNSAGEYGGGIFNRWGTVTLTNSTLDNNAAGLRGGGIFNEGSAGTLTLTNSTLSGNRAGYGNGGGIYNGGTVTLVNSTLSGNSAAEFGGSIYNIEGNEWTEKGTVTLARSIIAEGSSGENCYGEFTSLGDNLSSDATCITTDPVLNDRNNTDPLLHPAGLQDNGGPTRTIALLLDSPALDGVLYNDCPAPEIDQRGEPRPIGARCDIGAVEMNMIPVTIGINPDSTANYIDTSVDEEITVAILSAAGGNSTEHFDALTIDPSSLRLGPYQATATNSPGLIEDVNSDGMPDLVLYFNTQDTGILCRDTSVLITGETSDGLTIMGTQAIQTEGCNPVVIRVNVLTDETDDRCPTSCSIRAAIARANPGDEIQFDVNGTIVLTQGELVVDKDLTITGPGAESLALDGNYMSRVMVVTSGATASLQGLTLQNGSGNGGGIYNKGTLTLTDCSVSSNNGGNWGVIGGGLFNDIEGSLTLINTTLSGNWAKSGKGGGIYNNGSLTLANSTLNNNGTTDGYGSGLFNDTQGTATLDKSTLANNESWYGWGSGISNEGTLTLTNSTLSGNWVWDGMGGGIYNVGTVEIINSTIEKNDLTVRGGGGGGIINGGTMTLTYSAINNNAASSGGGIINEGTLTVTNSTISGNKGGGVSNGGTLTVTNSTVSGNSGGGISNTGTLALTNSTLSGNINMNVDDPDGDGYRGGGIFNQASYDPWENSYSEGKVTLTNSTLSGNSADVGGAIFNHEGDEWAGAGTVILVQSIIANSPDGGNCAGKITSQGDNLSSDSTCITTNRTLNDRNNTDPLLDPAGLQDNGGPILTIALQLGSPAIDGVRHGTCPPPDTDQRGVPRPFGGRCDIGAVEMSADSAPLTVALDIKPGSVKNHINLRSNEKIAVAILSTGLDSNAEPFDATRVDPRSVRFGPKGAKATHRKVKDVNHDGEADLILYFKNRATGIQCGDTSASLTGETIDGQAIQGSDTIKTVGLRCIDPEALAKLRRLLRYLVSIHGDHAHGHDQGGATH